MSRLLHLVSLGLLGLVLASCGDGILGPDNESPIETYRESRPLEVVFESLLARVRAANPNFKEGCLNSGASESQIAAAEAAMGLQFPDDLRTLYSLADGQNTQDPECGSLFVSGYDFLSLEHMVGQWALMKRLWDGQPSFRMPIPAQGAIGGHWWHPQWIPIGYHIAGDLICVDLVPSALGQPGQVIEFFHDDETRHHRGLRIVDYLGEFDTGLQEGRYGYEPEFYSFLRR